MNEVEFMYNHAGGVSVFVEGRYLYKCGAQDVGPVLKDVSPALYERFLNDAGYFKFSDRQLAKLAAHPRIKPYNDATNKP